MKWYGDIAFSCQVETELDAFEEHLHVKKFVGDILRAHNINDSNSNINVDVSISNQLSVLMDPFLQNNFHKIVYVTFMGTKWTVSSVDIQDRRLLITFGKVYVEENNEGQG